MVSTRGPRPRFHLGETVLCYEPDQSRCLALYDSKILEVDIMRDERGKRVPHYLLHFSGWNKSWDKWVKEELLLEDSEENRRTQQYLKHDIQKPGIKRKRANPTEEKNSPSVANYSKEKAKEETDHPQSGVNVVAGEEIEESQSDVQKETLTPTQVPSGTTSLDFPKKLIKVLEEDCCNVTQRRKLIRLPQRQTIRRILANYYDSCKCDSLVTEDGSLGFVEEMIDGLKTYTDWYLPTQLLYAFERVQHEQISENCQRQSGGSAVSVTDAVSFTLADHSYASMPEENVGEETSTAAAPEDESQRVAETPDEDIIDVVGDDPVQQQQQRPKQESESSPPSTPEPNLGSNDVGVEKVEWPVSYSDIYGIHHLLRLLVRLPEFLSHTCMSQNNYRHLWQWLHHLIDYLTDNYSSIVSSNQYIAASKSYIKEAAQQ